MPHPHDAGHTAVRFGCERFQTIAMFVTIKIMVGMVQVLPCMGVSRCMQNIACKLWD